jgi:hypothetical protein
MSPKMEASFAPYTFGAIVVALTVTSSALTVVIATSVVEPNTRVKGLVYFAFALQIIDVLALVLLSSWYTRGVQMNSIRWELRKLLAVVCIGMIVSVIASAATAASIGWISVLSHGHPTLSIKQASNALFHAWYIEWGVSVLAQMLFYGHLIRWTVQGQETRSSHRLSREFGGFGLVPGMQQTIRPQTAETVQSVTSRDHDLSSPPRTPTSSDAISSFRSSLSRTKLISHQRSFPRRSNNSSIDLPSRDHGSHEAFDSWDTSGVGQQIRDAVLHSSPNSIRVAALEPIPGSRPDSPANDLDGPFLPQSLYQSSANILDEPFLPQSPHQTSSSLPSSPISSPINFSRPTSRHRTPSVEDHIHPLFRTSSPTPPPTATPGTTVTAAPNAGQVISGRTLSRMRSGSLPSTSSPLAKSQGPDDTPDLPPSPSPAIPSFVLSAGTRTSLVGYGKRRGTLKATSEEAPEEASKEEEANPPFF